MGEEVGEFCSTLARALEGLRVLSAIPGSGLNITVQTGVLHTRGQARADLGRVRRGPRPEPGFWRADRRASPPRHMETSAASRTALAGRFEAPLSAKSTSLRTTSQRDSSSGGIFRL